jgi:hypothetical protein
MQKNAQNAREFSSNQPIETHYKLRESSTQNVKKNETGKFDIAFS